MRPPSIAHIRRRHSVASSAARIHDVDLTVIETTLEVANGTNMRVWAYGGTVPGPVLRATEGDLLRVALTNRTSARHTIHFHGAHDVARTGSAGPTQA
jgi:FtsP/CotA-like multicopper oxidase with cupredoxin domain